MWCEKEARHTIYSGLIEGAAMTIEELYTTFDIKPAEYSPFESPVEFARRAIGSNPAQLENRGVNYSSGTSSSSNGNKKTNNSNRYVMYSY